MTLVHVFIHPLPSHPAFHLRANVTRQAGALALCDCRWTLLNDVIHSGVPFSIATFYLCCFTKDWHLKTDICTTSPTAIQRNPMYISSACCKPRSKRTTHRHFLLIQGNRWKKNKKTKHSIKTVQDVYTSKLRFIHTYTHASSRKSPCLNSAVEQRQTLDQQQPCQHHSSVPINPSPILFPPTFTCLLLPSSVTNVWVCCGKSYLGRRLSAVRSQRHALHHEWLFSRITKPPVCWRAHLHFLNDVMMICMLVYHWSDLGSDCKSTRKSKV